MKNERWSGLAILGGMLCAAALQAQGKPADFSPAFGESIDVRVINVEAVVTDQDGRRITGLKPEDFRLRVDGKEVPIEYFSEVREGRALPPPATGGASAEPAESVQELATGPVGTDYLVFVDDYFSIAAQRNRVLQTLKADLGRLGPADRMAVVAYDGGRLALLSNWSGSRDTIAQALDRALARPSHGLERRVEGRSVQNDQGLAQAAQDTLKATSRFEDGSSQAPAFDLSARAPGMTPVETDYAFTLLNQLRGNVQAVVGAMRGLAGPRGRKVLLLLSGGWPFSVRSYVSSGGGLPVHEIPEGDELYAPLTRTANLLGYTIYPVEVAEPGGSSADVEAAAPAADLGFGNNSAQEIEGSLYFLAKETGGKPLLHGNRAVALAQAQDDTRSFYWLGFSPSWQRNDAAHEIRVEGKRSGLKVRSRTGFLDLSRKSEVSMKVESALLFGRPPGALAMPMKLGTPVRSRRGELEIPVSLGLPVDLMTVLPADGKYTVQLELRFAASDASGNSSEIPVIPVSLSSAKPPTPGKMVRYETRLKLRGKADHLVAAVYDPLSGKIATAETDVKGP